MMNKIEYETVDNMRNMKMTTNETGNIVDNEFHRMMK